MEVGSELLPPRGRVASEGAGRLISVRTGVACVLAAPCALLCVLLLPSSAEALELGNADDPGAIELHGFASQGFLLTFDNDYLTDGTKHGSFELSEVGINFTSQPVDALRIGIQLFGQNLGANGDFDAMVDWFYLDYRWQNWLGLRAGRLKIPYGLHNEVQDIDAARMPILLPQSVYPLQTRQILFAQTGAELYGFARIGALGALDYRVFAGTIFLDSESLTPVGAPFAIELEVPYVVGGRVLWETPLAGLRVGGSLQAVRLDTTALIPGLPPVSIVGKTLLWVGSVEYAIADLLLTAEYSRWDAEQSSDNAMLSPPIDELSERLYAMASYRITTWLQLGAYYGLFFPDVEEREGRENQQHDLAATIRFDLNPHWLVKLEGHYMSGTAGLLNPLRIGEIDISTA
ncbi:MAG TPA: hypothetical protein VK509_25805, partial [Polyangiales bacterium]|nr:hypothetical protein [Polyangiales bacterium]